MATTKFKLGKRLPSPARFRPDQTLADQRYIYGLDTEHLVCHRRPKHKGDGTSGYYQLMLPTEPKRRLHPTTVRTLKHGIVIPTLVTILTIGLLLVLYPLLPGISYQVHKQLGGFSNDTSALAAPDPSRNRLIIPKIGVDTTILEGPTLAVLNHHDGVWHQTGNLLGSNFVIAGHRFKYLPPNTSTLYNLGQVKVGDTVVVDWNGQRYYYNVSQTEQVDQYDTAILKPTTTTELTVYTCYDKRQTQRIVIIATPQP